MKEMMVGEGVVLILLRIRDKGYCEERETEATVSILYFRGFLHPKLMLSTGVDKAISSALPEYSYPKSEN
jgi:hypothetical protein